MPNTVQKPLALVVDDEPSVLRSCEKILQREGFSVKLAGSGKEALNLLERHPFDIVFTDLKMPAMEGTELLTILARRFPGVVPVVITGYATIASVVETMRTGAHDYLPKPFTPEEMGTVARRALARRRALLDSPGAPGSEDFPDTGGIVAVSAATRELLRMVEKVAPLKSTVLILGEEGTGKELFARAIHRRGPWGDAPFTPVECRRPSQEALMRELFGNEGEEMEGGGEGLLSGGEGTLFFDEICDLGPDLQARLYQWIHGRTLAEPEPDARAPRLVFASRRDLWQMVEQGLFRKDLYYHLYVFPILIPPLRERREDIPSLVRFFLRRQAEAAGNAPPEVTPEALRVLAQNDWPGNVRQLRATVEWAASTSEASTLEPRHFAGCADRGARDDAEVPRTNRELLDARRRLREKAVSDVEREFLTAALARAGGNVSRASREVGMQRQNFQALMRKHGIRAQGEEE
jgi:DNA-binding NtrC family response regulator